MSVPTATRTSFAGKTPARAIAVFLLVLVTACGTDQPLVGSVTLSGDPGSVVAADDVKSGETVPEGVTLSEVRLAVDGESLRTRFVLQDDLSAAITEGGLSQPPVWSLSLWRRNEAQEAVPSFWIAVTWPAPAAPTVSALAALDVWICPRAAFPEGAEHGMRRRQGAEGGSGSPSAVCSRRSAQSRATAHQGYVDVEVPLAELDGLQPPLLWTAVATASRSPGTVGWSHCVPACPESDWSFPPAEARATLPQDR